MWAEELAADLKEPEATARHSVERTEAAEAERAEEDKPKPGGLFGA